MSVSGMGDRAILRELGRRLKRKRLQKNITQGALADRAGIHRTTIVQLENGAPSGTLTLVKVLRALNALEELDSFLPEPGLSPLELLEMKGRERRRASGRRGGRAS